MGGGGGGVPLYLRVNTSIELASKEDLKYSTAAACYSVNVGKMEVREK